jgi:hypothetical protein
MAVFPCLLTPFNQSVSNPPAHRWVLDFDVTCRLCGDDDSLASFTAGEMVTEWEEAFCNQLAGSGIPIFSKAKGCRILSFDAADSSRVTSA